MATATLLPPTSIRTVADLLDRLGGIPPERVRFSPVPGTATEEDVIAIGQRENRWCELVDGVLVEKPMGLRESLLAMWLGAQLIEFVRPRNLGLVSGESGTLKLFGDLVRIPDVAFISWDRIPGKCVPTEPIPALVPDLAVEVLSASNTKAEMTRKLGEYFSAGVRLVWLIDPEARTVVVHTAQDQATTLLENDRLDGNPVLPGFSVSLRDLFAELDQRANG
jgi:Uma2 family endonuclease